jgi:hypothetical protein
MFRTGADFAIRPVADLRRVWPITSFHLSVRNIMTRRMEATSYALALSALLSASMYLFEGTGDELVHPWSELITWLWMPASVLATALWLRSIRPASPSLLIPQKWSKVPPRWFRLVLILAVLLGMAGYVLRNPVL